MQANKGIQPLSKLQLATDNTLIGMSMICPAKFSLDLEDNVINFGILDAEPFPVTYKQTNSLLPTFALVARTEDQTLLTLANHVSIKTIQSCISQAFLTSM
jgi:hypothetical protein